MCAGRAHPSFYNLILNPNNPENNNIHTNYNNHLNDKYLTAILKPVLFNKKLFTVEFTFYLCTDYWRMIMAEDQFVITPANYNRQLDVEFRQKTVSVDYSQLTDARTKCLEWIEANREYFSL